MCYEDFFLFAQKFLVAVGRSLLTIFISGYLLVLRVVQYCRCSVSLKQTYIAVGLLHDSKIVLCLG